DLGHYERFIDENLTKHSSLTAGKVYSNVLKHEREGAYLGATVQVIPHVTEEIKNFIYAGAKSSGADVLITEIGGTTGDIESQPFLEAIRQISLEVQACLFIHVTLIPYLKASGEHKSKPTQHSVKELRAIGITPNIIITRADEPLSPGIREKISLFCNVKPDCVIENMTLPCLYEAPLMLHENGLDQVVCRELKIDAPGPNLSEWKGMLEKIRNRDRSLDIAIVGKYVELHDAYLSLVESLNHAGFEIGVEINVRWLDSEDITDETAEALLGGVDGVVIPGGFGDRGIDGKISACKYVRENNIPFLGICLGMQIAVIEFARNLCGLETAHSAEFDEDADHRVIDIMQNQVGMIGSGGTMRLGAYPCKIKSGSVLEKIYSKSEISERHRHRFEFNNNYQTLLENSGMSVCGTSPDSTLVEAVELPDKDFFVGVQFHPEFKSRPNKPHPLFLGLLNASLKKRG
ncbi:MAG: CTP synthase, partial [Oscillospiraceae bacterium]|nr:CTP synthase [Oscillospiraceae bacterium]